METMYNKIEDMSHDELKKLICSAMDLKLTTIKPIPYEGVIDANVKYFYPELVACCPMTGINDTYKITIEFIPDKFIPELKSFKIYLLDYKNMRISHEHILAKIFRDFKLSVKPKTLKCVLEVFPRGGIYTTVEYYEKC